MQRSKQFTSTEAERGVLLGGEDLRQARDEFDQHWNDHQTISLVQATWYVITLLKIGSNTD